MSVNGLDQNLPERSAMHDAQGDAGTGRPGLPDPAVEIRLIFDLFMVAAHANDNVTRFYASQFRGTATGDPNDGEAAADGLRRQPEPGLGWP